MSVDFDDLATEAPDMGAPDSMPRPPKPGKNGTTIKRGPGRPPKEAKTESEPISQASLKSGLYGFFSTIAMVVRADVAWKESDFEQMAKGIMIAGKRVPQVLILVMNVMTPALAIREFLAKINDLMQGRQARAERDAAESVNAAGSNPDRGA